MKYPFFILCFVAFFYLLPIFKPGLYGTHDAENLIARIAAYHQAFSDGHIPPRWAGTLNYGYGAPVFIFFYPMLGYLGAAFHTAGFSYEAAYKILAVLSFVGSGLSFFLWARFHVAQRPAIFAALVYLLSPYHLLNLYVRGDVGELMALAFAPLVFFAVDCIPGKRNSSRWIILGSIFYAAMMLAHQGVAFLLTPLVAGYAAVTQGYTFKTFRYIGGSLLFGLGLSAYFWLPGFIEARYTLAQRLFGTSYLQHFLSVDRVFVAPWGFGDHVNRAGGLAPQIGLVAVIFVVILVVIGWRYLVRQKIFWFWLLGIFVSAFFALSVSSVFWKYLPIWYMEFPWRFLVPVHFSVAALFLVLLKEVKQKIIIVVGIIILLVSSFGMTKTIPGISRPDRYYDNFPGTTNYYAKATTIWSAGDKSELAEVPVGVISGNATITDYVKKTHIHTFHVVSDGDAALVDNTMYYPGWQVLVNGKKTPIEFQDPNYRGLITFRVPPGSSTVKVIFSESPIRLLADSISVATAVGIMLWFILASRRFSLQNKIRHL